MSFDEWKKVKINELCSYSNEKIAIEKLNLLNYISTENMLPNKNGITKASSLPNTGKATKFHRGDILVSNIRPYFKKIWFANKDGGSSNDVLVFKNSNPNQVDNKYLYYNFVDDKFFNYVVAGSKGTKMPRGDKEAILNYEIYKPPLDVQQKIASILSALDDKIELNNRMNKVLEQMAQAIFKQWFVDFEFPNENGEPYKSSGGEMEESELGLIPKGWTVRKISEVTKIVRGASPRPIQDYIDSVGMPWIKISDATESNSKFIIKTKEFIKEEGISKSRRISPGTLILSNSATPGIPKFVLIDACVHDGWLIFDDFVGVTKEFLYYFLLRERDGIVSLSNGSVFRNLKTDILKNYKTVVPPNSVLEQANVLFKSINESIESRIYQNERLIQIRDTLLPKLMSGEIDVSEVEL